MKRYTLDIVSFQTCQSLVSAYYKAKEERKKKKEIFCSSVTMIMNISLNELVVKSKDDWMSTFRFFESWMYRKIFFFSHFSIPVLIIFVLVYVIFKLGRSLNLRMAFYFEVEM